MCGIVGLFSTRNVNQEIYDALTVLQHRGQDSAGIMTCEGRRFYVHKSNGLVREVFQTDNMVNLPGNMGIGHIRYPTSGMYTEAEAQPFYVNSPYGIALAHNGNLTNAESLQKQLFDSDLRHINTSSDSEVLLNVLAHELQLLNKHKVTHEDIFSAISIVHQRCKGAYGVVAMIAGYGVIAFRDPNGIRPVVYGTRQSSDGETEFMVASESVALNTLGFDDIRDLQPGEAVVFDKYGQLHVKQCANQISHSPCIFEYVYLARPDSVIDDVSVYKAHIRFGDKLAAKLRATDFLKDIDVVIPIPETSRPVALQVAYRLGLKYREGFIKNRYIGRTFIMPGQSERKRSVKRKLNAIESEFSGNNVLLVDDSIVRGTTSKQIIQMARDAGAKKVYFASAAPAIRYPNVYGIDMPTSSELVAYGKSTEEVCQAIGADKLVYQELDDLVDAVSELNPEIKSFDTSVFDGKYVTNDVDEAYLNKLEQARADSKKKTTKAATNFSTSPKLS